MPTKTPKKKPVKPGAERKYKASPDLESLMVPIGDLQPDPENVRTHSSRSLDAIRGSLVEFGYQKPVVVSGTRIIAGNGTYAAAVTLGWTHIPVLRTDLTGAAASAYGIADNRVAEFAEWDLEKLAATVKSISAEMPSIGMSDFGFSLDDLRDIGVKMPEPEADPDDVPLPPDEAITMPGDIWVLGNHRLMCGDSRSRPELEALLASQKIHLVNTDPPYNVAVEPRSNNAIAAGLSSFQVTNANPRIHQQAADLARYPSKGKATHTKLRAKDRPIANDFVGEKEFEQMLFDWFGNMAWALIPGGGFYIWGGYANCANYPPALKATEMYFSQSIIWVKQHPVLGRKDFMGNHEWCFYGWREGAAHRFFGPNNIPDVWEIKKVNPQSMVHLTEKPVELARRAIEYSSNAGENVLDLFGGSGSTLIAAEIMQRNAFLMELDPLYCDVIVQRWEKFTNKKATRVSAKVV